MRARRSRMDIYHEIIEYLVNEPKRATHIIYHVNMSWVGFQSMIGLLKQMNLVHEITSPRGGRLFCITDKGKRVAEYSREVKRLMVIDKISL